MSVWSKIGRLFAVDDTILDEDFSLLGKTKGRSGSEPESAQMPRQDDPLEEEPPEEEQGAEPEREPEDGGSTNKIKYRKTIRPRKIGRVAQAEKEGSEAVRESEGAGGEREPKATQASRGDDRKKAADAAQKSDGTGREMEDEAAQKSDSKGRVKEAEATRKSGGHGRARETEADVQQSDDDDSSADGEGKETPDDLEEDAVPEKIGASLAENRERVEFIFRMPTNADVVIRDFWVVDHVPVRAFAVFMEGLSDTKIINEYVLEPLMLRAKEPTNGGKDDLLERAREMLVPGNQVAVYDAWTEATKQILTGSTALFFEGIDKTLVVATNGWAHRGVGETKTETVVRGPHDAFTENLRANTGLVRARLRTERLITEMMQVGELAPTDLAIMYVDGIVNPALVEEVKRRIEAVKVDFLQDSGQLEQFIEDPPRGLIPRMMATERPDRVAQSLSEGFVSVFVGQSPYVLIMPTMLWSLIHTPEDAYLRFPFGSFIRLIRFIAFVAAMLLPAIYIAITNYHPEMIPTDLMLTIAAAREKVPFPLVLEVLLMELALELIREAGIRIPNVIGPTIGIVGALILGQAAVQAAVISPLLVIVVAVTALSAFTMPNYNISFAVRTLRFLFIFLAACWGFYGITLGVMFMSMHWAQTKSFGVPMLTPIAPFKRSSPDVIIRGPIYEQEMRPRPLYPQSLRRQAPFTRSWAPTTHDSEEARRKKAKENPDREPRSRR